MDTTKIDRWVERIVSAKETDGNLTEVGKELGLDPQLSQADYEEVLRRLSIKFFSARFASLLDYCAEHREQRPDFWIEIILNSRDDELGGNVVGILVPFLNLTELLRALLRRAEGANANQKRRIVFTLWGATCVVSVSLNPRESFSTCESLDRPSLAAEVRKALPLFPDRFDHNTLIKVLGALEPGSTKD